MRSDAATVNCAVYNQLVDELVPQYLSVFCLSHKFELAWNDAFQISKLNENSENSYTDMCVYVCMYVCIYIYIYIYIYGITWIVYIIVSETEWWIIYWTDYWSYC